MEQLVVDLEDTIWRKYSGNSTPLQFCNTYNEVKTGVFGDPSGNFQKADLGRTVCYIVSAVVVQDGRVLMMREAKSSCRGRWYLPAGRVEKNESFEEAVIREVLEETGLHFQPTSIISIDSQGTNWFRFSFGGVITNGKIKTLQEQDAESMEAGWFSPENIFNSLSLRCEDICPLIRVGLKWYERHQEKSICKLLPVGRPYEHVVIRVVVVKRSEEGGRKLLFCVLLNDTAKKYSCPCFPYEITDMSYAANIIFVIDKLVRDIDSRIAYKLHGYLNVEHTGKPQGLADGLCLTLLVEIFVPFEGGIKNNKYNLFQVEDTNLSDKIWELIDIEGCVKLQER